MRYWAVMVLVVAAFALQITVSNHLSIAGVAPDLLLVLTLSFGLLFGWEVGAGVGLAGGLLLDLAFGRYVGLHGLALGVTGLLVGLMESTVVKDNLFLPTVAGVLGNLMARTITLVVLLFMQKPVLLAFRSDILISTAYNAVLCAIIYPWLYRHFDYLHPTPRSAVPGNRA